MVTPYWGHGSQFLMVTMDTMTAVAKINVSMDTTTLFSCLYVLVLPANMDYVASMVAMETKMAVQKTAIMTCNIWSLIILQSGKT